MTYLVDTRSGTTAQADAAWPGALSTRMPGRDRTASRGTGDLP
jgi:hypothetical protein